MQNSFSKVLGKLLQRNSSGTGHSNKFDKTEKEAMVRQIKIQRKTNESYINT